MRVPSTNLTLSSKTLGIATLTAVAMGFVLFAGPSLTTAAPACTITGTPRADTLRGTPGNDVICGLGGDDRIFGRGGADLLNGGPGNDSLDGGTGKDRLLGSEGNDSGTGGEGSDLLSGGNGSDDLEGLAGNDSVNGDSGADMLMGDDGPDRVNGGAGDDLLMGGAGVDAISPGTGSDTCAPDGADQINGVCSVDQTGPAFSWVDVPGTVEAGTAFTATFSLEDPSGIATGSATASIGGAPGWITTWCGFRMDARLISGTEMDGVWSVSCDVPENAVSDPYSLWAGAQDNFGNSTLADWVEFVVVGGSDDNRAPVISEVSIPASVQPGETATITWRAADPSGVAGAYPWVYLPGPPWGVLYGPGIEEPVRISGDANDGLYSQTFTLPADSPPGTYAVYISVRDELGNKTYEQYGSFSSG